MKLGKTALMAHSRSGGFAIQLALDYLSRSSPRRDPRHGHAVATAAPRPRSARYEAVQARVDKEMARAGTHDGGLPQAAPGRHLQPRT